MNADSLGSKNNLRVSSKHRRASADEILHAALQAGFDKLVELAVEHRVGVAAVDTGTQILHARLIEHVRTNLVAPLDVGLARLDFLLFRKAQLQLALVHA